MAPEQQSDETRRGGQIEVRLLPDPRIARYVTGGIRFDAFVACQ